MKLAKNRKKEFLSENVCYYNAIFNQILLSNMEAKFFENVIISSKNILAMPLELLVLNWWFSCPAQSHWN